MPSQGNSTVYATIKAWIFMDYSHLRQLSKDREFGVKASIIQVKQRSFQTVLEMTISSGLI